MYLRCPQCQSDRVRTRNIAKRTCAILGTIAGAIAAALGASQWRRPGPVYQLFPRDDLGKMANRTANTLLSALIGASTGGGTGAKLGEFIDEHILDNYQCQRCKHTFDTDAAHLQDDENVQDAWMPEGYPAVSREFHRHWGDPQSGSNGHINSEEE